MRHAFLVFFLALFLLPSSFAAAQRGDAPPAPVVVEEIVQEKIQPSTEYIGTVYFSQVSSIASEISGIVLQIHIQEGELIKKGTNLCKLQSDLLQKRIQSQQALLDQVLAQLEKLQLDLERAKTLYASQTISEQEFETAKYSVLTTKRKADALRADLDLLKLELRKTRIKAPFPGVILTRHVEQGEWVNAGEPIVTLADNTSYEVLVQVPGETLPFIQRNRSVLVRTGVHDLEGSVFAVIPRGNTESRTVPVKIKIPSSPDLAEGLEARVMLPSGPEKDSLIFPRDALIAPRGQMGVYVVQNGKARFIPVDVVGYEGSMVGVQSRQLQTDMQVIIKGNERLQPGQSVQVSPPSARKEPKTLEEGKQSIAP